MIAEQAKPVFPCRHAPDKSPLTRRGFKDATTDLAKIHAYWNANPGASIGMPTGRASGIFVMDVDRLEALEELEKEHGKLPVTLIVRTPRGGWHIYFQHVEGITNSPGGLPKGIDVRGEGGYVLVPPSPGYTVENKALIAPAPEWLLELIKKREPVSHRRDRGTTHNRARVGGTPSTEPIHEGGRNRTLFFRALDRKDEGRPPDEVLELVLTENYARCTPPLEPDEVEKIVKSAMRYPTRSSTQSPEVEEIMKQLWQQHYEETLPGGGRSKERDCERILFEFTERFGKAIEIIIDGEIRRAVAVSISARQGAIPAACSHTTFATNMKRLAAKGKIRPSGFERKDEEAKTWLILEPATKSYTSTSTPSREECSGVKGCRGPQRTPCFRWGGLVGTAAGGVLVAVETWGAQTADELAERVGYSRGRDLRARHLDRLVEMGFLTEDNGFYSLSGAYEEKVGEVKRTPYATSSRRRRKSRDGDRMVSWIHEAEKVASEGERERMDALRHEDEQKAYRNRLKAGEHAEEEITALLNDWSNERADAAGEIRELEHLEPLPDEHPSECGCLACYHQSLLREGVA